MQIYLARNKVQAGPYTLEQLNNMLATREVDLDDLMWHEGMSDWQRIGAVTGEHYLYRPEGAELTTANRQVNVSDLYAKPDSNKQEKTNSPKKSMVDLDKKARLALAKKPNQTIGTNEIASVGSRILAVLVDQALGILCFIPVLSAINFDLEQLSEALAVPETFVELMSTIPEYLAIMTGLMLMALFVVQMVMLVRRGQSIGKLITGVRIVDIETLRIPSVTNLVLIRTIVTNVAYILPTIGFIVLVADTVTMVIDKQHRSLHDKIAKTVVVKSHDRQLQEEPVA